MSFNRNIITTQDIENYNNPNIEVPALDQNPPAGLHPIIKTAVTGANADADTQSAVRTVATSAPGGLTVPSEDDYITKLLKYVPAEILGLYLFVDSLVRSNTTGTAKANWLIVTGLVVLVFTVLYDHFTLKVARRFQILVSVFGVAVYIFTVGGWFATTSWYHSWYSTIAVAVFAVTVGMLNLRPLPVPPAEQDQGVQDDPGPELAPAHQGPQPPADVDHAPIAANNQVPAGVAGDNLHELNGVGNAEVKAWSAYAADRRRASLRSARPQVGSNTKTVDWCTNGR